jgi:hypothetical protein
MSAINSLYVQLDQVVAPSLVAALKDFQVLLELTVAE